MYSAIDIAKYIIKHSYCINNLKLQKVLYFIQAEFLVSNGYPCFDDDIEAWGCGPVVPFVYRYYKMYGSCMIYEDKEFDENCISERDRKLINPLIKKLEDYSSTQLTDITLHQSPWTNAYNKYLRKPAKISNQEIYMFFSE